MLATFIIVFREIIEAGLIVGIVMAAARGVRRRGAFVALGIGTGIGGACIVAAFASTIGNALAGAGQEVFNATVLGLAVIMLGWHNVWMARHGRELADQAKLLGRSVANGERSLLALSVVVSLAVLREGAEVVLFLYGISVQGSETAASMLIGGGMGVAAGTVLGVLIYAGLLGIPARHLFRVTSTLIALLAAGMGAQAVAFLEQAGLVDALAWTVWDTSNILSETSLVGRVLHTLVGYVAQPSALQLLVYVTIAGLILGLTRGLRPRRGGGNVPAGEPGGPAVHSRRPPSANLLAVRAEP